MKILVYPHEILKQKADPVKEIDGQLQTFIDDMFDTMYKAEGIGLAANQVGKLIQVVVLDVGNEDGGRNRFAIINPFIAEAEGEEVAEEGCLSVPGYGAPVKRASRVLVKGIGRDEKEIEIEAEGILARCLQHELDHLNGVCFVDRLNPVKRALFRKKWAKIRPQDD